MVNWNDVNPFSRRESHSPATINTYKALTALTWLLSVGVSIYDTVQPPREAGIHRILFWSQNYLYPSAFTMNHVMGSIFWIFLFVLQFGYLTRLFSENVDTVNAASSVGSHFIVNNLLHTAFVLLFVHSHFIWAEVILVVNFINLSSLYFRHNKYPRSIHTPVVSGPLSWTFVALYWNGAIMVHHQDGLIARIFGNVFIWSILAYGLFFLAIYNDYTMGLSLSVLAATIGVGQFLTHAVALQWIFAFVIMGVLFLATLGVAVPVWTGSEIRWRRRAEPTDAERAPLLNEE